MKDPKIAQRKTIHSSIVANQLLKTQVPVVDNALRDAMLRVMYELTTAEQEKLRESVSNLMTQHSTSNGLSRPVYRGRLRDLLKSYGWAG